MDRIGLQGQRQAEEPYMSNPLVSLCEIGLSHLWGGGQAWLGLGENGSPGQSGVGVCLAGFTLSALLPRRKEQGGTRGVLGMAGRVRDAALTSAEISREDRPADQG